MFKPSIPGTVLVFLVKNVFHVSLLLIVIVAPPLDVVIPTPPLILIVSPNLASIIVLVSSLNVIG